jgi:hypothetical protein
MHNTSFAQESPVEGVYDLLDFWRDRQMIAWYGGRRHRGIAPCRRVQ